MFEPALLDQLRRKCKRPDLANTRRVSTQPFLGRTSWSRPDDREGGPVGRQRPDPRRGVVQQVQHGPAQGLGV